MFIVHTLRYTHNYNICVREIAEAVQGAVSLHELKTATVQLKPVRPWGGNTVKCLSYMAKLIKQQDKNAIKKRSFFIVLV